MTPLFASSLSHDVSKLKLLILSLGFSKKVSQWRREQHGYVLDWKAFKAALQGTWTTLEPSFRSFLLVLEDIESRSCGW